MDYSPKIKVGDTVKLKPGIMRRKDVPEGREANNTAKVRAYMDQTQVRGGLIMERDLMGCKYWNEEDVIVVQI